MCFYHSIPLYSTVLSAVVMHGFLYIAGGEATTDTIAPEKTVYRFDPRTIRWMEVAPMLAPRQSFQMAVLNATIYAIGNISVYPVD